jgi:ribonuclease P protein component
MKYVRLKKQADFQKLFSKGKRAFSSSFTMLYRPFDKPRMGISLGKKHGKAVKRNRIKRLIREAYRAVLPTMQGTYSIVLVPKVQDEYTLKKFTEDLKWMIRKEKL